MAYQSRDNYKSLKRLRNALLELHKSLLDFQIERHRKKYGRIKSPGKLYEVVLNDPSFSWLRQLSELIVSLDEVLDHKKDLDARQITDLRQYVDKLLKASSTGNKFAREYFQALQKEPSVGLAHSKVLRIVKE